MKQIFNPYLPLNKCIPDAEPHVFGDRVYIYGSQDREGGTTFCELDYEVWSAPVTDLTDWRCDGVIYKATQDKYYGKDNCTYMYAPDVVQGNDGRYYLYYCTSGEYGHGGYFGAISVAVCDTPAGKFEFYGCVKHPDGSLLDKYITFDPGLMNDNGKIYLYYGAGEFINFNTLKAKPFMKKIYSTMYNKTMAEIKSDKLRIFGANCVELEDDMLTVKSDIKRIVPSRGDIKKNNPYYNHGFFEAASMRKFNDTYYFVYSDQNSHTLCYSTSKYPDRDFEYRGVLVSNGDVFFEGKKAEDAVATMGNIHGGIEYLNGEYYIFYHRMTHNTQFSRQACAEKITMDENGLFSQVQITSCGLNGKALVGKGEYPSPICCHLTNGKMKMASWKGETITMITHSENEQFITAIENGTIVGFKYFDLSDTKNVSICIRGSGSGKVIVSNDEEIGEITINPSEKWTWFSTDIAKNDKNTNCPLYFTFNITGTVEFLSIKFD